MIIKFREVGNSMTVTIPKEIVSRLEIKQGMEADISMSDDTITVKPLYQKDRVTIRSLFEGYKGDYTPGEIDWGEPRGKEVW